jgi:transposase InsO family protein
MLRDSIMGLRVYLNGNENQYYSRRYNENCILQITSLVAVLQRYTFALGQQRHVGHKAGPAAFLPSASGRRRRAVERRERDKSVGMATAACMGCNGGKAGLQLQLRFIEPGKPQQNAYIESFNGKFRDECLN